MLETLKQIVLETESIFFNDTYRRDVKIKGESDFVTRADLEISSFLHNKLKEAFPEISFVSEEENTKVELGRDYFILDPINGTTNFMYQIPLCGISLGLLQNGEITAGIIYLPYAKELFWAEKGKGAFLNGEQIFCNSPEKLSDCLGFIELNPYFREDKDQALRHAEKIFCNCRDLRTIGCAAASLAYVACGRADVFLGRYLKPWDYAAGKIIVEEAGGKVTDLNGSFHPEILNSHIVATCDTAYNQFLKEIKGA